MLNQKNEDLVPIITKIGYQFPNNILSDGKGFASGSLIIIFKSGFLWNNIIFSPGSASFIQKDKDTDAGKLFEQSLKLSVPGENDKDYEDLSKLDGLPVVVKFEYSNGIIKIIGTKSIPAEFSDEFSSNASSSKNIISFNCISTHRVYTLES